MLETDTLKHSSRYLGCPNRGDFSGFGCPNDTETIGCPMHPIILIQQRCWHQPVCTYGDFICIIITVAGELLYSQGQQVMFSLVLSKLFASKG